MSKHEQFQADQPTWCPGCGNFAILQSLKAALSELELDPHEVLMCSGIGQAGKMPHYIRVNGFNGLHGRALPPAVGACFVNPELTVIVESGDGDNYGEGGNHLLHTIRRNPNIAHFVHNNQVYGLTKGQASPTSDVGMTTNFQTGGVTHPAFNPLTFALVTGAGFVARGFSGEREQLTELMKAAIEFPGYALVDILQPCGTFNKVNTAKWYREHTHTLEGHDSSDWDQAINRAREWDSGIPLGIFYSVPRPTMESHVSMLADSTPFYRRPLQRENLPSLMKEFF